MSRMTKYLKQVCQFEPASRDSSGSVVLNEYGDVQYSVSEERKCRREKYVVDILTGAGAILKSSSRYFFDETSEVFVDDRVDGHVILSIQEYTNEHGECEGYECYV